MAADNSTKYQVTIPIDRPVVAGDIVLLYYCFEWSGFQGPVGGYYDGTIWRKMNSDSITFGNVKSITSNPESITIVFDSDRSMVHAYATVIHTDISNLK